MPRREDRVDCEAAVGGDIGVGLGVDAGSRGRGGARGVAGEEDLAHLTLRAVEITESAEVMAVGLPLPVNNLALTVASLLQLGSHARATYVRRQSSISRRETDLNGALISRCSGASAGQRTPIGPLGAFYGGAASDCLSKAPLRGEELNGDQECARDFML